MKKVVIYYFSGCGNSKWVTQAVVSKFQEKNTEAIAINIEGKYISQNADLVGFIFPIYSFGLPKIAVDFIKNYPARINQRVFVLTVPALHEGIGLIQANILLTKNFFSKKECDVVYARSIYMPDTWTMFFSAPKEDQFELATIKAEKDVAYFVSAMLAGERHFAVPNPLAIPILGIIYWLFYVFGRHFAGKCFAITSKCNSCRICYDSCPAKVIEWKANKKPYWKFGCHQCFRCINKCPKNAIEVPIVPILIMIITFLFGFKLYHFLPRGIEKMLEPFWIFPQILFWLVLNFFTAWLLQNLSANNMLPDWFFTSKKKRYRKFFDEQKTF